MDILKAGEYKAIRTGYIHDKLRHEGDTVVLSAEFIEANPKFTASWLELVKAENKASKPKRGKVEEQTEADEKPDDSKVD